MRVPESHEVEERELTFFVVGLLVVAAVSGVVGMLVLAGLVRGGGNLAIALLASAASGVLAARGLARIRDTKRETAAKAIRGEGPGYEMGPWMAVVPPMAIGAAVMGAFGYLVGGLIWLSVFAVGALVLVWSGLRAQQTPAPESPLLRIARRLSRRW
jgi:hypothetical protein